MDSVTTVLSKPSEILSGDRLGKLVIYSDFDGTISSKDSLKYLLSNYAQPEWSEIENGLSSGTLSERDGLQMAFDLLQLSAPEAFNIIVEEIKIDPSFKDFALWAQKEGHELRILSGGIKSFIDAIFAREGLSHIPVLANEVMICGKAWTVVPNPIQRLCPRCNHCKSASLVETLRQQPQSRVIYIGDGHTDICPVQLAHRVYAKGYLKEYCQARGVSFTPFENFGEILRDLKSARHQTSYFQFKHHDPSFWLQNVSKNWSPDLNR